MNDEKGSNMPDENTPEPPKILDSVVTCKDGALSGAGGKSGACSYHGGVSDD